MYTEAKVKDSVQEARMSRSGISFATAGMGLSYLLARQLRSGSAAATAARIAAPAVACHLAAATCHRNPQHPSAQPHPHS